MVDMHLTDALAPLDLDMALPVVISEEKTFIRQTSKFELFMTFRT